MQSKSILWPAVACLALFSVSSQSVKAFDWPVEPTELRIENIAGGVVVSDVWVMARVSEELRPEHTVWYQCRSVLLSYQRYTVTTMDACYEQILAASPAINSRSDFTRLSAGTPIALPLTRTQAAAYLAMQPVETQYLLQADWELAFATIQNDIRSLTVADEEQFAETTVLQNELTALSQSFAASTTRNEQRFSSLDSRLTGIDQEIADILSVTAATNQQLNEQINQPTADFATNETVATIAQSVTDLRQRVEEGLEQNQSTSQANDNITSDDGGVTRLRTFFGAPWWNIIWFILFVLAAMTLWFFSKRQATSQQKSDTLQQRQVTNERDTRDLYSARLHDATGQEVTEAILNDKELEHTPLVLEVPSAGHGAAIPRIQVYRKSDSKGTPYLELFGAKPGENAVHPSQRNGEFWFKLSSFEQRFRKLSAEKKIGGLKQSRTRAA